MTTNKLPSRIAAAMAGTVVVLLIVVGASVLWMTRALDRQSHEHSSALVGNAFASLLDQTLIATLYDAKWDAAAAAVAARDQTWLQENVGAATAIGTAQQLAVVWGGGLGSAPGGDLGWLQGQDGGGQAGILGSAALAAAEARLAPVPVGTNEGAGFYLWRGSQLFAVGVARVEATEPETWAGRADRDVGRLMLGRQIGGTLLRSIEQGTLVNGIDIDRVPPDGDLVLPLPGADGAPVAFVSWRTPPVGTAMLRRMVPLMLAVAALAGGLASVGAMLARRSADVLVQAERRSAAAARTDGLTGLPNRLAFAEAVRAPARAGERAVLFLDLNGFKRINDTIGHAAGDAVVAALARRLGPLADAGDLLARVGGDEFVLVLRGADAGSRAAPLAQVIEAQVAQPIEVVGHRLRVSAALGYAVQAADGTTGEDLVRQADLAMYEAKRRRAGPVAFDALIETAARDARAVEGALREALARDGELTVAYQPIVDARSRRFVRAEALARWTSPVLGAVGPDRFIPVAEQAGLMGELGRKLLAIVADDLHAHPGLCVSLNVSPVQLLAPSFVADMVAVLAAQGVEPARVEVELTEGLVVSDPKLAAQRLDELHAAGFSTALDDFGTGYSSIGYLDQMPFDVVKIDRSFVKGVAQPQGRRELVGTMIRLGHVLRLGVVCEGVETDEDLAVLGELGCDLAQGYRLDRPMPIGQLADRWLAGAERSAA